MRVVTDIHPLDQYARYKADLVGMYIQGSRLREMPDGWLTGTVTFPTWINIEVDGRPRMQRTFYFQGIRLEERQP